MDLVRNTAFGDRSTGPDTEYLQLDGRDTAQGHCLHRRLEDGNGHRNDWHAAAFLATLYVAQRNYLRGREHIPHLTMTLSVERVPVSMTYDVVVASLDAKNTGSGLCTVTDVNWMVVAVSPYDDETVNSLMEEFGGATDLSQEEEFPWYKVAERPVKVDLLIEPGETEQLTQEFVIESVIGTTITSAYVVNGSEPRLTDGWYRRSLHKHAQEQP